MLDTLALRRVLPLCTARNHGVMIDAPYAGGWLVAPDRISYMYGETPAAVIENTAGLQAVCRIHNVPLAVAAVIPGARTRDEATETQCLLNVRVPAALWTQLKRDGLLDESAPTPACPCRHTRACSNPATGFCRVADVIQRCLHRRVDWLCPLVAPLDAHVELCTAHLGNVDRSRSALALRAATASDRTALALVAFMPRSSEDDPPNGI